ncbi:MAG: thioredoxin domain-containing protein [Nocardioidaceae bacterium]|nr:thioredoxin domain-containing protein [Nocardioidaceae bacterium]
MSKQSRDQGRTERAAAVRAAQERKERNRRIGLIAAIVVLLGAIVAGGAWYSAGGSDKPGTTADPAVAATPTAIVVGEASAPVKLTVYEDFLCPFCRQLESETRDFLRESAASGKVQVTYQPINLLQQYEYSARALNVWAAVLENGTPKQALALHDLLYEHQPYETDSESVSDADLAALVEKAGATGSTVTAATKTRDEAFFAAAAKVMSDAKVQGTPTVVLDGKEVSGASVSDLVSQIERAVGDA